MTPDVLAWRRCAAVYGYGLLIGSTLFVWAGIPTPALAGGVAMALLLGFGWVIPAAAKGE